MRIIINLDRIEKKKKLRIRSNYYFSEKDDIRLKNCGVDLYNAWGDVLGGLRDKNTEIVMEGERR